MVPTETALIDFVTGQRWYGSKTRVPTHATLVDRATLRDTDPKLELQLIALGFDTGTHETYQLLTSGDELDALEDPRHMRELVHMMRSGASRRRMPRLSFMRGSFAYSAYM